MDAATHLTRVGVSVWLDSDSPVVAAGDALGAWLARHGVAGVGPTLPAGGSDEPDRRTPAPARHADRARLPALPRLARVAERIADQLRAVHAESGGLDGLVQFPTPPALWSSPRDLVTLAADLARLTRAPNLAVGLPFNRAGLAAAEELILRGSSISIGPVFTPLELRRANAAYGRGLQRRVAARLPLSPVAAVAWIPVQAIGDYARELPAGHPVDVRRGLPAAIAELIYLETFRAPSGPRWGPLRQAGATRLRAAFCHSRGAQIDDGLKRLVLPGSILALGPQLISAIAASPRLPVTEPDETEAAWELRQAARAGLRLAGMSDVLRARFESHTRLAWRCSPAPVAANEQREPAGHRPIAASGGP